MSPVRPPHKRTWTRNTTGLAQSSRRRAEAARARAERALEALLREGRRINFNAVAAAAQVTKAYLYQQDDLRRRIEALRGQAPPARKRSPAAGGRTEASARVLLVAKDRRIRELEQRVRELDRQLADCRGTLYDRL
jgi:hypothetical protein